MAPIGDLSVPAQTPLFHAQHVGRYERQEYIKAYEGHTGCRLLVVIDEIFPDRVVPFEELLIGADPDQDMHLLLHSPGGDGETAVRLVRSAQARCRELTVIVPDQAKSAATLLCLGAHRIVMGPASDLGPIDPLFPIISGGGRRLVPARDLIAAVDFAADQVQDKPDTFPLHASLLSDISGVLVQQARSEMARTDELLKEALISCPGRDPEEVERLTKDLHNVLVEGRSSHAAVFGYADAKAANLPVVSADPRSLEWQLLWRLYAKYVAADIAVAYEGAHASQVYRKTSNGLIPAD